MTDSAAPTPATPETPSTPAASESPTNAAPTKRNEDFFQQAKQHGATSQPLSAQEAWSQAYRKEDRTSGPEGSLEQSHEIPSEFQPPPVPPERRQAVNYVYDQIDQVFQQARVAPVDPGDPEWPIIQAELENPAGSLALTLVAAAEAAQAKRRRLLEPRSTTELWEQAYKR